MVASSFLRSARLTLMRLYSTTAASAAAQTMISTTTEFRLTMRLSNIELVSSVKLTPLT